MKRLLLAPLLITFSFINMGFIGAFSLLGLSLLIDDLHLVEKLRKL